ncbi:BglG family transcription antiterminator [Clostridium sp. Marseille-P2415]|uniref:BglG family transcription antiterminator n=1 Tax=Clostridium sp. Marseille-P2415 TaxID=1805471 RepID=UPI0009885741|nr:PTS sugar transporter subunit IIA [Clostridium sp. Marseille-P2415]
MKQDKNSLYYNRILKCLLSGRTYTIVQLADSVGLSEKTLRTKINQLNDWMENSDLGSIKKKQGTGIWLDCSKGQLEAIKEKVCDSNDTDFSAAMDNRNRQLTGKLLKLKPGEIITMQKLAESLYLSPPTVANMLKKVSPWFEKRNLQITSVRNKGICIAGDEYNYRIAIKDYILYMMPEIMEALLGTYAPGVDVYRIRKIIVDAENAWRIELADISFNMVWIMTCLSLSRSFTGGKNRFGQGEEDEVQHYNEYSFAESIYQRIGAEYRIKILPDDVRLLSVLLLSARKIEGFSCLGDEEYTRQYDKDLNHFVKLVIETIDSVLDVDISSDKTLYESLLIHMRSAIFRMKYSTTTSESISKYVKSEYKQTFLATWSTSNLFEEYYGVQVTEDELAGIALYIQASLIRMKKDQPLMALMVSQQGLASSQLIMEMIKYSIPEIADIKAVSNHDFKISQYPDVDLIISSVPLNKADPRIVMIGDRMSEDNVENVRKKVKEMRKNIPSPTFRFHNLCHQLFDVDLIFFQPCAANKDDLLKQMVKRLEEKGDVTSKYLESVYDREKATATGIGHGIAIPHGNMMEVNESRIAVAVLDQPMEWSGDLVDVVFLLAVKMTSNYEIRRTKQFYKDFLLLTEKEENMEIMKNLNSALEIYQYFIR